MTYVEEKVVGSIRFRLAKSDKNRYIEGFDFVTVLPLFKAVSVDDSVFQLPIHLVHPDRFIGESDVVIGGALNPYWFYGDENNFATRFLEKPEQLKPCHWPLMLFGPSGVGKTALALSVANSLCQQTTGHAIAITGNSFRRRLTSAIDTKSTDEFQNQFYVSGAVVVDNIQQLISHELACSELCLIIDELNERQIPIIFTWTSDSENELTCFPHRLSSRLISGLSIRVDLPNLDSRLKLIQFICRHRDLELHESAELFLATKLIFSYPKQLGFLNRFSAWISTNGFDRSEIGLSVIRKFLSESANEASFDQSFILREVAKLFGLKMVDLIGKSRKQTTVLARNLAIYLLRTRFEMSYTEIGQLLGGRDHSTIIHSFKTVSDSFAQHDNFLTDKLEILNLKIVDRIFNGNECG